MKNRLGYQMCIKLTTSMQIVMCKLMGWDQDFLKLGPMVVL